METLLSSMIAVAATVFFMRRHVKSLPPAKPAAQPVRRKRDAA